jgi:hypothetical protein
MRRRVKVAVVCAGDASFGMHFRRGMGLPWLELLQLQNTALVYVLLRVSMMIWTSLHILRTSTSSPSDTGHPRALGLASTRHIGLHCTTCVPESGDGLCSPLRSSSALEVCHMCTMVFPLCRLFEPI